MQSEKIEQLKSDKSEFQDKLSEVELENSRLIAQTKELEETLLFDDKRKIISDADALQKMNLIGAEHSIKARGLMQEKHRREREKARATLGYWLTLDRSSLRAELESHQSELQSKQADGRSRRRRPSRKRDQGLEPY